MDAPHVVARERKREREGFTTERLLLCNVYTLMPEKNHAAGDTEYIENAREESKFFLSTPVVWVLVTRGDYACVKYVIATTTRYTIGFL